MTQIVFRYAALNAEEHHPHGEQQSAEKRRDGNRSHLPDYPLR
jgi:hypothetical protein